MRRYKLKILELSEIRWKDFGSLTTKKGYTLLYSGVTDEHIHREGVGILMTNDAHKSLLQWHPVSERIITARSKAKVRNISIIQCYVPTEASEINKKLDFYRTLRDTINKIRSNDITIVMGNLNAKVGDENYGLEQIVGKYGLRTRNENGNLQSGNEAESESEEVEQIWNKIKENFIEVSEQTLGYKNVQKKDWMTTETWATIEQRRKAKHQINVCKARNQVKLLSIKYNDLNREVKRKVRRDKRKWFDDIAKKVEVAANRGDLKTLYQSTKILSKKLCDYNCPIRDKDGTLLTNEDNQLSRWKQYFEDLVKQG
ncbi:hypothetical protein ANN_21454 [Periplaneta americana]|uniref:Craniofacial development protein 2-like n=1 Tax=Periplaneta americana TaxID=6978 RepID=A0ABQ8SG65_PERAM|nr:hypothetical protein ANN_21454 [Periplaneta americana]